MATYYHDLNSTRRRKEQVERRDTQFYQFAPILASRHYMIYYYLINHEVDTITPLSLKVNPI